VEVSHWDPVYDVVWIQSKTAQDVASVSSDGRLLFWDVRKLDEVCDEAVITDGGRPTEKVLGACALEWMMEAGAKKFLVGTEHGVTIGATRTPKKAVDVGPWWGAETRGGFGKHFGPVYAVKRNPIHVKFFMTVGDWCCKMWSEELKDATGGPILKTPYCPSFLSAASWSPTRCGVFYLARQDGFLDTWDYCYRMNEVSLTQKVSDSALTSLKLEPSGSLMAVGDADGTVTLMQMCDSLVQPAPNERNVLDGIFSRETKREKNLDAIRKATGTKKAQDHAAANITINEEEYRKREAEFLKETKSDHDATTLPLPR
jgi:dynein intermediate chain 2